MALDLDAANQVLCYEQRDSPEALIKVDAKLFEGRDVVELRYDLMDCNILVCSPELLVRFTDEFDFEELRRDFLSSVLADMLGDKLYDNKVTVESR